ncbi:MAG: DUF4065 domain-containing protein [Sumerlaeia bacterium]
MNRLQAILILISHQSAGDPLFCRAKLEGLLFFAEHHHRSLHGETLTGEDFLAGDRGPVCRTLEQKLDALLASQELTASVTNFHEMTVTRFDAPEASARRAEALLEERAKKTISRIVASYAGDDAKTINHFAQQFPPWEATAFGEAIPWPSDRLVPGELPDHMKHELEELAKAQQ